MKLITFKTDGVESYGTVTEEGVRDAGYRLRGRYPDLKSVLAETALEALGAAAAESAAVPVESVEICPVIPNPNKILCIGINYEAHRLETGRPESDYPTVFIRFADTLVGQSQPIRKPLASDRVDWEGELAVIIGRSGRAIPESEALNHVAGYACFNDVSIRDWQRHTGQFSPGKNFPATGPFGPWMVTTDDIPDPHALTLCTRVNGEEMQRTSTDDLTFGVPALINYISTFTPLSPGDVISTGTPGGVGHTRKPPVYMKDGDSVEVEISGIGVLKNPVVNE
ncbi:MAG: 5-carboxymethyl-2-hydroxymuconate isomerase [Alphaproteobacteria bacterium]|nr:5-carboxymethyl-2-hydroxymuconate isomerase [Alphaproteobacteria bacterium]|tara:strand:- start:2103 stop:2948 length:846 start_codon:yes stop_codon:yes gene_type:complete